MKLKIRYENEFQTINLDEKATQDLWVSLSIDIDDDMTQEEKELCIQKEWDEQYNKPEYNIYHRETRHIDPTPKRRRMDGRVGFICGEADDQSFNIMDYLAVTDQRAGYDNDAEYQECRDKIRSLLKPDAADMVISIALEGKTLSEYASLIGDDANNVSHRYRRAIKKIKKSF